MTWLTRLQDDDVPKASQVAKLLREGLESKSALRVGHPAGPEQEAHDRPLGLTDLRRIGRKLGVIDVRFGEPLSSEGELSRTAAGGYVIRIASDVGSNRARFTLAHEFGHIVFQLIGGQGSVTARRGRPEDADQSSRQSPELAEERFCDRFAAELLMPLSRVREAVRIQDVAGDVRQLVRSFERVASEWGVSIATALGRAGDAGLLADDLLGVLLRVKPHAWRGVEAELRIVASQPRPARRWFIPFNRRARTVGFVGAQILHDRWIHSDVLSVKQRRRSGVLSFGAGLGNVIEENARDVHAEHAETIEVSHKRAAASPWQKLRVQVPVIYRYYAVNASESYCLALMDMKAAHVIG